MFTENDYFVQIAQEVAVNILKTPGDKVISVATRNSQGIFTFSDDEPNDLLSMIEQENDLANLFELILDGIMEDGMIVIRQFTGEVRHVNVGGLSTLVPTVNTYAIRLSRGRWYGLSAEQVEMMCSANLRTGEPTVEPPGVKYIEFVS